ncbi:MAG TPA: CDP-alcohol phosphatidyltransferase family protein [Spirochaetota bacterium]|jgi:phosphatidylglycerophosphate synthase|nr:CDP-alcohol phosphatidyltransferase family protein [Spirochaetota bacterium]HQO22711.1 CDP-alcohol phosphatidyltransferase family protein [Spirochaetota bacterium]HQQ23115.1 CDP-alcohol phosphatidyltransferase family protein [Spirochaetota bacterium]
MKKNGICREIKLLQKYPDGIFGSFMTRPVSHLLAALSYKLHLSPNFVSFLSFVFCIAGGTVLFFPEIPYYLFLSIALWWLGAIFDAADGDLARYVNGGTPFGGWFDSFLDRLKEFFIFAILGYLAWKKYNEEIYLLFGLLSIFSNVMSGYISDTKKLFISVKRKPEIVFSKKYSFGMVDTRDFVVIVSLFLADFRIALITYSTLFASLIFFQTLRFYLKYGRKTN